MGGKDLPTSGESNSAWSRSQEQTTGIFVLARRGARHEQGVFFGMAVVASPSPAHREAGAGVQRNCGGVRFPDLEMDRPLRGVCYLPKQAGHEKTRVPSSADRRVDGELQDFELLTKVAPLENADDPPLELAYRGPDRGAALSGWRISGGRSRRREVCLAKKCGDYLRVPRGARTENALLWTGGGGHGSQEPVSRALRCRSSSASDLRT